MILLVNPYATVIKYQADTNYGGKFFFFSPLLQRVAVHRGGAHGGRNTWRRILRLWSRSIGRENCQGQSQAITSQDLFLVMLLVRFCPVSQLPRVLPLIGEQAFWTQAIGEPLKVQARALLL